MKKSFLSRFGLLIVLIVVVIVTLVIPRITSAYQLSIFNITLIYAIGCLGISIMMGMGGYMMLSATAFMGIGGFLSANLAMKAGFPVWLSIIACTVAMGILAYLLGQVLLNLTGSFFAFASMGIVQISFTFLQNYKPFSGGPDGLTLIPPLKMFGIVFDNYQKWFYVLIVLMIVTGICVERVRQSSFGRALQSIRDDKIAAQTLGVNPKVTAVYAFTVAGLLAGLTGGLIVHHNGSASATLFVQATSTRWFLMSMIGGINSTVGTILGVILMNFIPEVLRIAGQYMKILDGVLIVILMIFMPMGLMGLFRTIFMRIRLVRKVKTEDAD